MEIKRDLLENKYKFCNFIKDAHTQKWRHFLGKFHD